MSAAAAALPWREGASRRRVPWTTLDPLPPPDMTFKPPPLPAADLVDLSDSGLLVRVAQQDPSALAELFHRYGGRVLAYVRAMAGPGFPHEDAVQDIFLALWQKAGLYAPEGGEAAGWIFTLTRHKVLDLKRSLGRVRERGDLEPEALDAAAPPEDPTLAPSIQKALAALPEDQRAPIRLAYYGDLTYDEAARRLGLPVGTVKTRIRAGLATLRELFQRREAP
ncbi:MAG: RNA polymerase sigma factor [Holophagaceae bacterium]